MPAITSRRVDRAGDRGSKRRYARRLDFERLDRAALARTLDLIGHIIRSAITTAHPRNEPAGLPVKLSPSDPVLSVVDRRIASRGLDREPTSRQAPVARLNIPNRYEIPVNRNAALLKRIFSMPTGERTRAGVVRRDCLDAIDFGIRRAAHRAADEVKQAPKGRSQAFHPASLAEPPNVRYGSLGTGKFFYRLNRTQLFFFCSCFRAWILLPGYSLHNEG